MGEEEAKGGPIVPESVFKKRKKSEEWPLVRKQPLEAQKKKNAENRKIIFTRAEKYAKEYADQERELIKLKREARLKGGFYISPEVQHRSTMIKGKKSEESQLWLKSNRQYIFDDQTLQNITGNMVKVKHDSSWAWRSIISVRNFTKNHALCIIGNGHSMRFWLDPWNRLGFILLEQYGGRPMYDLGLPFDCTVSHFICNASWNLPQAPSHVLSIIWDMLTAVFIPIHHIPDMWCSTASEDEHFSIASAIQATYIDLDDPPWINHIWFPNCLNRHSTLSWFYFNNSLKTKLLLHNLGLVRDVNCILCCSAVECDIHLLQCGFSRRIWLLLLGKFHFSSNQEILLRTLLSWSIAGLVGSRGLRRALLYWHLFGMYGRKETIGFLAILFPIITRST